MKAKAFKIVNLILAVLVCVFALSQAFAWFAEDMRKANQDFNGSSASPYFESGDGSEDSPFILSNYNHLYNLAWLQNTGNLNDNYYYFKLKNNITVPHNFWLPPIGTDYHPFQGYFNGNGKQIINLKITTDSTKLTSAVSGSSVKYSNAVGMFGMTKADTVKTAKIYNFNLINPIVEVANSNAVYADSSTSTPTVGFAVGFANCGAEKIGVLDGKLAVKKNDYTTKNSIIGGYDGSKVNGDEIDSTERGNISYFIPSMFTSNKVTLGAGQWLVSEYGYSIGTTGTARWEGVSNVVDSTLGLANFSLVTAANKGLQFRNTEGIKSFTLRNYSGMNTYTTGDTISLNTVNTQGQNWGGWILNKDGTSINVDEIKDSFRYLDEGVALGNSSLAIVSEDSASTTAVENINSKSEYASLLANAFYFNITEDEASLFLAGVGKGGNIKVGKVMSRDELTLLIKKKAAKELNIDISGKTDDEIMVLDSLSGYDCYDFYFRNDYDIFKGLTLSIKEVYNEPFVQRSSGNGIGYNFDLSKNVTNAGPGLYVLYSDTQNGDIHYIRATGISYGEAGLGGGTVDGPSIKDVDFIYEDSSSNVVLIKDANFIATDVIVKFTTDQITYLYFYRAVGGRDENTNYTLEVKYNGTQPTAKASGDGVYNITPDTDLNDNTLLTYPSTS